MKPITMTTDRFQAEVLESDRPVLLDFWAPWCGPCRAVSPVFDQIAAEYDGRLTVVKVNVDEEPALAGAFGIRSIPTLAVVHRGEVVGAAAGALPKAALVDRLGLDGLVTPAEA